MQGLDDVGIALSEKLYARARSFLRLSYCYLGAIVFLMIVAIVVFIYAAGISRSDSALGGSGTASNINVEINKVQADLQQQQQLQARDEHQVISPLIVLLNGLIAKRVVPNSPTIPYSCCGLEVSYKEIAKDIRDKIKGSDPSDNTDEYTLIYVGPANEVAGPITLHRSDWLTTADDIEKLRPVFDDVTLERLKSSYSQASRDQNRAAQLNLVNQKINDKEAQDEANHRLGIASPSISKGVAETKFQLIQTSITRFGTISLVVFLVGILSGLYRYTVKLAAFYRAQADALSMISGAKKLSELQAFSTLLTPRLDFGKQPATPTDQLIDLLKALRTTKFEPEE